MKHTPGPWNIGATPAYLNAGQKNTLTIRSPYNTEEICTIWTCCLPTEANAKLIAAAPELLAACVEFVRKVDAGEAKSTRSYNQMKQAIKNAIG